MKRIINDRGITLTTLVITIVVLMIVTFSITTSVKSTIETRNYNSVKEDIINLSEAIKAYYLEKGELPIDKTLKYDLIDYGIPDNDINPNDNENYYRIRTTLLQDVRLNRGEFENNDANSDTDDMYVVNEKSFTVYYLKGAVLNKVKHYTIVDNFSGGGFAEDYYSRVTYPIFSVITEQSNNSKDKTVADTGEVVTLKMISKYEEKDFTQLPTVTMNGEDVTNTLLWEGNVLTATYIIPVDISKLNYGDTVEFEIYNYSVKNKDEVITGEKITDVNFGKKVTRKHVTLVEAFKDGSIKVGDFLNYNDYVDESKTYTTVTNENGWADQTYKATKKTYWQVLGLDKTGKRLMLISQSPIKKEMKTETTAKDWEKSPYLVLKGAYGYINCKQILNNISGIYSTNIGTAQSMTAEEINRLIGVTVDYTNKKVYANTDTSTNIDQCGVLGNQYTYKASDYTPESYINDKTNATEGTKTDPATIYYYPWNKLTIDDTLKTILFSGTTSDVNFAKSYVLASPAVGARSGDAYFGPGVVFGGLVFDGSAVFYSYGNWDAVDYSVRPLVYLNSNITTEDLHVIDGQEDDWSAYSNLHPEIKSGDASNGEAGNHGS